MAIVRLCLSSDLNENDRIGDRMKDNPIMHCGQLLVFTMGRNSCQAATNENNN